MRSHTKRGVAGKGTSWRRGQWAEGVGLQEGRWLRTCRRGAGISGFSDSEPDLTQAKIFSLFATGMLSYFVTLSSLFKPDGSAGRDQVRLRKSNAGTCVFFFGPCQTWHIKCSWPYVFNCIFAVFVQLSLIVFFVCGDGPFEASYGLRFILFLMRTTSIRACSLASLSLSLSLSRSLSLSLSLSRLLRALSLYLRHPPRFLSLPLPLFLSIDAD